MIFLSQYGFFFVNLAIISYLIIPGRVATECFWTEKFIRYWRSEIAAYAYCSDVYFMLPAWSILIFSLDFLVSFGFILSLPLSYPFFFTDKPLRLGGGGHFISHHYSTDDYDNLLSVKWVEKWSGTKQECSKCNVGPCIVIDLLEYHIFKAYE